MKMPWEAGHPLAPDEFEAYCRQAMRVFRYGKIPLQVYKDNLPDFPLLMKPGEWPRLVRIVGKLSREVLTVERELIARKDLYPELGLPREVERVLRECETNPSSAKAPRVMRFDFYHTTDGWKFSEVNPDTVGGFVEAYGFTAPMAAYYQGYLPTPDAAAVYATAIRKVAGQGARIAIILAGDAPYAVRQAECIIRKIEARGMRAFQVRAERVRWVSGVARVIGSPSIGKPALVVRQLMAEKLYALQRRFWEPWFCGTKTPVSNPCQAILVESKRLPCILKELEAGTRESRSNSPESRSPAEVPRSSQEDWVFKPAYGSSGYGVAIAGVTKNSAFNSAAQKARSDSLHWVAQRRFESVPVATERGPGHVCLGIYTVDGVAAGAYARIKGNALIDSRSLSIPVLIPENDVVLPKVSRRSAARDQANSGRSS